MIKNPCYDKATHTDCPNRKVGCSALCSLWAAYDKEKTAEYERRKKIGARNSAENDAMMHSIQKARRRKRK